MSEKPGNERMIRRVLAALLSLLRGTLRAVRGHRWGLVVTVVSLGCFLFLFANPTPKEAGQSDGHYMWMYARSIVFDHDIDFANDYAICGDPHNKNHKGPTGHSDNPFYAGPAVVWAPVLWVVVHTTHLRPDASARDKAACDGPLSARTLRVASWLGALTVWLMYLIARRHGDDAEAAVAAALLGLCSTLPAYATVFASYSHVYDAFWAAVAIWATLRAVERPRAVVRWAFAGAAVGLCLLQRPVSAAYGLVPALLACVVLWKRWMPLAFALAALGAFAILCGVLPQMLIYRYLYGSMFPSGVGHDAHHVYMQYWHTHPWLVLFAPHGGLFYSTPTTWIAVLGAALGLRDRKTRPLVLALLLACAAVVWATAAALDWSGSGTFGARRLTSLLPLMATPTVLLASRAGRWLRARPGRATTAFAFASIAPIAFTILGATHAMSIGRVSTDNGSSQANFYGTGEQTGWGVLDEHVGDVALLPAEILFHLRYGVPMNTFRDATESIYSIDYFLARVTPTDIDLTNGNHENLVTGMASSKEGMHMTGRRASVVFAAQWHNATAVTVRGRASRPTRLRVGRGGWFGTNAWGEVQLDDSGQEAKLTIPAKGFDSGIVDIVFQRDSEAADVTLTGLRIEDDTKYE